MPVAIYSPHSAPFIGWKRGRRKYEPQRDGWWVVTTGGEHYWPSGEQLQNIITVLMRSISLTHLLLQRGPQSFHRTQSTQPGPAGWDLMVADARRIVWQIPLEQAAVIGAYFDGESRHEEWAICMEPSAEDVLGRLSSGLLSHAVHTGLSGLGRAIICVDSDWGIVQVLVHESHGDEEAMQRIAEILENVKARKK